MDSVEPVSRALLEETEAFLHEKIPLTRAMKISVSSFDAAGLVLEAPLEENHNHLGTAFGGSLSVIATLAAYAFLWIELHDREAHVVIRDSAMSFLRPVRKTLRARCAWPAPETLAEFKACFSRKGKARIVLHVAVEEDGETAVAFQGTFVARR